jgi:hypothetical protein
MALTQSLQVGPHDIDDHFHVAGVWRARSEKVAGPRYGE